MDTPSVPEPSRATERARLDLSRLPSDTDLPAVFARACAVSAHTVGVERVGVWLFIDDRAALRCAHLYERTRNETSSGAVLRVADFPTYFASLTLRKAIPAEVATTDPWTAELRESYLRPLGIASMLDAGIFVEGNLVGVVCHEHVGAPREWTTEDRDFAGSVADLLALRIQAAEVRDLRAAFLNHSDRLAAQDKAAALEQLAAGIAHDFLNLLTVIHGQGELLTLRPDTPAEVRDQGKTIVVAARRGIALVKELQEFARPTTRPPTVLDLATVTADFLPVLRAAVSNRHEVRFTRPAQLGQVLIDRNQFTRVLLNLVTNAAEAMPDGGPVGLRLAPVKLTGHATHAGPYVLVEVTDKGIGMDDATRQQALKPYFTTKSKGTGLGLAIVQTIVERAGGLLRIDSTPGKGTTVRLFLPRIGASTGGTADFVVPPELRLH